MPTFQTRSSNKAGDRIAIAHKGRGGPLVEEINRQMPIAYTGVYVVLVISMILPKKQHQGTKECLEIVVLINVAFII